MIMYTSLLYGGTTVLLATSTLAASLMTTSVPDIRASSTDIQRTTSLPITSSAVNSDTENAISISSTYTDRRLAISSTSVVAATQSPTVQVIREDSQSPGSSGLSSGAVIGIVFTAIILLLLAAIAVTAIIVLTRKRKIYNLNKKESVAINNPNYGDVAGDRSTKSIDNVEMYAMLSDVNDTSLYALPDTPQHYEMPDLKALETSQQFGIYYVPTEHQREHYQEVDDIYSYPELKAVVCDGSSGAGTGGEEESFFTESDIYWVPASSSAELYEQLSKYRFREIQRSQIETKDHLGSGQFGTVNKGVWQCPGGKRDVAIKLLQAGASEDSRVRFLKEAAIMGQFSHPNVISLLGVVTLGEPVVIVMELMQDGDLRGHLIKMKPIPGEMAPESHYQQLLDFCQQISAGMTYLSEKAFVHRDIAARNILLSGRTCKIADFGMARDLVDSDYYTSQGGQIPVKWTAPEALHYKKYSTASDVWSFGCLMYEIWSLGHKPFEGYTNAEVVRMVMTGWRLPPPPGCPREMYRLMICCWNPDSSRRPQFSHLLQTLSRPEHELLSIPEEVKGGQSPQASILGAPLEVAKDIYTDLQKTYITAA